MFLSQALDIDSPYEDMVDYFEQEGFILEDCEPVDINETTGYLTDNTNGEFTETKVAASSFLFPSHQSPFIKILQLVYFIFTTKSAV